MLRAAPAKAIDFFAFETFKALLGGPAAGPAGVLASGALAGATSCLLLTPLDLVRARQALGGVGHHQSVVQTLQSVVQAEGPRGLYRGAGKNVLAILPEAAIAYGLFDLLKTGYRRLTGRDASVPESLAFGVTSALAGQTAAFPLETLARRAMAAGPGGAAAKSSGVLGALRIVPQLRGLVAAEGVGALYAGITPATLRIIPMAMISFATYEFAKRVITAAVDARRAADAGLPDATAPALVIVPPQRLMTTAAPSPLSPALISVHEVPLAIPAVIAAAVQPPAASVTALRRSGRRGGLMASARPRFWPRGAEVLAAPRVPSALG